ncbi:MAG: ABC transporter ATP-binding protein [Caldilineaceae bacterium]|nr:ABC transporter ATP-binding protein [Caldilineaceae bacterium]MCY4089801.1 ABC transporter ATP-binding protein [Caldilineaceae bacterium]MCY4115825.1 ABC transporter ATP-binding protein [Caldilineaceae bacterium]MDE0068942.1 ABC transporter ATP-binding protein [Caldilineaceae bacterium]MDE0182447.1 ABC transporter ATP-binding protein [Caldilineaceae bacterium]
MTELLLEGKEITVTFGRGAEAFDAVRTASVTVSGGEAVGIVGESGSGKTTLARVLVGLQRPSAGEVRLEGERIFSAHNEQRMPRSERWKTQMIFQDPYSSLNPRMRVWQAVAEAVQVWHNLPKAAAREEALRLLQTMGISDDQARQFPKSLSGGQRQRVSVARALAPGPKVLIADEPTSSIDQSAQAQLLNLLRRLQTEQGLSIIFISHDLGLVRYLTSRVYVMQKGDIVETGETQAVMEQPQHPYTRLLIDSIPGRGNGAA